MKTYKDLTINNYAKFKEFAKQFESSSDWKRNKEKEVELNELGEDQYCYEYIGKVLPSSLLWISKEIDSDKGFVTNIIPINKSSLTMDEYNKLIDLWAEELKRNSSTYSCNVSSDERSIASVCSKKASDLLLTFSRSANKSTGHSHPLDEKRWFEFVFETVISRIMIDGELLKYELKEHGWSEDAAYELSLDYEYGFSAMKFAMESR